MYISLNIVISLQRKKVLPQYRSISNELIKKLLEVINFFSSIYNYIFNKISKKSRLVFEMYYKAQITFSLQFLEFLKFYIFFLT